MQKMMDYSVKKKSGKPSRLEKPKRSLVANVNLMEKTIRHAIEPPLSIIEKRNRFVRISGINESESVYSKSQQFQTIDEMTRLLKDIPMFDSKRLLPDNKCMHLISITLTDFSAIFSIEHKKQKGTRISF